MKKFLTLFTILFALATPSFAQVPERSRLIVPSSTSASWFRGATSTCAGSPTFSATGDTNSGINLRGSDVVDICSNGLVGFSVSPTAATSNVPLVIPQGSSSAISLAFGADTNTGFFGSSDGITQWASNANTRIEFNEKGIYVASGSLGVGVDAPTTDGVLQTNLHANLGGLSITAANAEAGTVDQMRLGWDSSGTYGFINATVTPGTARPLVIGTSGGTALVHGGPPAGAATSFKLPPKKVTGIADNVATDVLTVTIPNANHAATIKITLLSSNGSTDAFESSRTAEGSVVVTRTTGANAVATAATLGLTGIATVAAGATHTLAYNVSAITGAAGASNTFTIQVTIDDSGNLGSNQVVVMAEVINAEATGVTIQ